MSYLAPFAGLKVVDLSQGIAGPYCAMLLAQYGADVIKVEPPGEGDWARTLGAHYAGADKNATAAMGRYGRYLGIAFQIVDDLLDLEGDEATTGKSLGTDLEQQKPTLPLIRLLAQSPSDDRRSIMEILTRTGNHRREALQPWFAQTDALGYARARAEEYAAQAREELANLPETPAKSVLEAITHFVVARQQ